MMDVYKQQNQKTFCIIGMWLWWELLCLTD
jgi:hypothetical protein